MKTSFLSILATAALLWCGVAAQAAPVTVTDIVGRSVTVDAPVERVILGEGRQLYVVAALDRDNPAQRIAAWRDDLIEADPNTYRAYRRKFPAFADTPAVSGLEQGLIDIETVVAQKPDVVFLNFESLQATKDAHYVEKLAALDIPVVYVDFRHKPMQNTVPSIRLFGTLFGKEERAEALIEFRRKELVKVTSRIAAQAPARPKVFVERAAGFYDDCCHTFGDGNIGKLVRLAGGKNIAATHLPGTFGKLNPEQVIAADPAHVVVTSADWEAYVPGGKWVPVGPGAAMKEVKRKLAFYPTRSAYTGVTAQDRKTFHAIWHQFYNSPYQFIAVQQLAKWFHPQLFSDLDPDTSFRVLHDRFLPIDYEPGYFASLRNHGDRP